MDNWIFLAHGAAEGVVAVAGLAGHFLGFGPGLGFLFPGVGKTPEGEMCATLAYTAIAAFGSVPYIYMFCSPISKAAMMPAAVGGLLYHVICTGGTLKQVLDKDSPLPGPAPEASGSRHLMSGVFWTAFHAVCAIGFSSWMLFKKAKKKSE